MKKILILSIIAFALFSCEKDITFNTENVEPKLVVDAQIETNQPPIVILTKSANYFSTLNSSLLNTLFVHNAKITINNGSNTHQLKEYSITQNGITYYFYSNDIANPATSFVGENGKQYSMQIESESKTYTSTTTIPILAKKIDSIWWKKPPVGVDTTFAVVMVKVTDPPGLGNYIRFFIQQGVKNTFLPADNSAFDDQVVDGKTYQLPVSPGVDRNNPKQNKGGDSAAYFLRGDTVTLKFCNIDKASYNFWSTWEFAYSAIGNPFSAPNVVLGNISNNALGAFSGYATQFKTVVIPK